jgi:hypothetical protein
LVWQLLDLTQVRFKNALIGYDKIARNQSNNADAMFKTKKITAEDALKSLLDGKKPQLSDQSKVKSKPKAKKTGFVEWLKRDWNRFLGR